jgi:small subunit ribosomal protein S8
MRSILVPFSKKSKAILSVLLENGMIQNLKLKDDIVSQRKIQVDLKYRHNEPVLRKLKLISKPSRRIFATKEELLKVVMLNKYNNEVGDLIILDTPIGILESRDALKNEVGGEVLLVAK